MYIFLYVTLILTVYVLKLQELNCYIDYLLSEAKTLSEDQISMLVWETIIETSDTALVATEWAMYELAKDAKRQVVSISKLCASFSFSFSNICSTQLIYNIYDPINRIVCTKKSKTFVDPKR